MEKMEKEGITRREAITRAVTAIAAVALSPLFPRLGSGTGREDFLKKIGDREASYYRRLAG